MTSANGAAIAPGHAGSAPRRPESGVFACRDDDRLTLVEEDGSLRRLTGRRLVGPKPELGGSLALALPLEDRERFRTEARAQLEESAHAIVECRVTAKDGGVKWVWFVVEPCGPERPGCLHCVFCDVTAQHRLLDELAASESRYAYILSKAEDSLFEWGCLTGSLVCSPTFEKKFGHRPPASGFPESAFAAGFVHPDDVAVAEAFFADLEAGRMETGSVEHRMRKDDGSWLWVRVTATVLRDVEGRVVSVIGLVSDIESQKKSVQRAHERSLRDPLTGLYNHGATKALVTQRLEASSSPSALMFIDLDDFKNINDAFGHAYGDVVLEDIAFHLKGLFGPDDVVGRIGGDEFAAYLAHVDSKEQAEGRAEAVLELFRRALAERGGARAVSASVGVAFCPWDATTYAELLEKADRAMYAAKTGGKNRFRSFSEDMALGGSKRPAAREPREPAGGAAPSSGGLAERLLDVLLGGSAPEVSVPLLLDLVGRRHECDQVGLYLPDEAVSADARAFARSFEWGARGAASSRALPERVAFDGLASGDGGVARALEEGRSVVLASDGAGSAWLAERGLGAACACPVLDGRRIAGLFVCGWRSSARRAGEDDLLELRLVAVAAVRFLGFRREQAASERRARLLDSLLANASLRSYVVDPATRLVVHAAPLLGDGAGRLEGRPCHRAVRSLDAPCPDCPLDDLGPGRERVVKELFLPEEGRWMEASASYAPPDISDGRALCLVSCHDVTAYRDGPGRVDDALRVVELQRQLDLYRKSSGGGTFVVRLDEGLTLLYGNDLFYKVHGFTEEGLRERLGNRCADYIDPEDLPRVRGALAAARGAGEASVQWEMRVRTGEGSLRWVLVVGAFETRGDEELLSGIAIDTTETHQLRARIERSEERYRIALRQTNVNVWEYDHATRSITVTESSSTMHGYEHRVENVPESLIADGHIHPSSAEEFRRLYARLRAGEPFVRADILTRHADGAGTWWERISYTNVFDAEGRPVRAIAVGEDVTRQKEMEIAYHRELQMRTALSEGVIATSRENLARDEVEMMERAGRAFRPAEPLTHEELLELGLAAVAVEEDRARYAEALSREALLRAFEEGREAVSVDYRRMCDDGSVMWANASIHLACDASGDVCAFGVIRDIDEDKRLELALPQRVERDPLMRVYDQEAARRIMDEALDRAREQGRGCALLVFGVDGFRGLALEDGWETADAVQKELSAVARAAFGHAALLGRFYGDELVVLLRDDPALEDVERAVAEVRAAMAAFGKGDPAGLRVSCRMALGSEGGVTALYRRAVRL